MSTMHLPVIAKKRRHVRTVLILLFLLGVIFRFFCGVFVIQPIGALPEGATIIYWRSGLNIPFVASADGMLEEKGLGVSLLGRAIFLGKLLEPISNRKIFKAPYSETLYLWSTGGKRYDR